MSRSAFRSPAAVPLTWTLALTLASCGGGPKHIGEITPEVQDRLSGAWVLNVDESDDPQEALDAARARPGQPGRRPDGGMAPGGGAGGRGGLPGAGGRGGMPGSGGAMPPRGGQGGPRGGGEGGDPRAMRATMRLVTVPPRRLQVTLSDSLVSVAYTAQNVWQLPFGEKVKRESDDAMTLEARAQWDNGRLVVRRSVSGGGSVTETFMPSMDGTRLTVAVESSLGGRGGVELHRVYDAAARD